MRRIDYAIIDAAIHTLGTCPGCREGGCFANYHCPCDGCECWRNDPENFAA